MPRKRLPERDLPLSNLEGISAVLRPAETVRAEEALLAAEEAVPPPPPGASPPTPRPAQNAGTAAHENARTGVRTHEVTHGATDADTYDGTDIRAYVRADERENARIQVRNAFNVWDDQLRSLAEIQAYRYRTTGKKPQLSHLVQEALDAYIARWRRLMEERAMGP